jgi:hypothetical protein
MPDADWIAWQARVKAALLRVEHDHDKARTGYHMHSFCRYCGKEPMRVRRGLADDTDDRQPVVEGDDTAQLARIDHATEGGQ